MPSTFVEKMEKANLVALRRQVIKQQLQLQKQLHRIDKTLKKLSVENADQATNRQAPPLPSPLDEVQELLKVTEDLRGPSGNLSAKAIAKAFGVSLNQLATWLGRTRQSLSKTPDADSLQNELAFFERVARLRAVMPQQRFLKWLRMPHHLLDEKAPLELMAGGEQQVVVDFVEDMLTGAPS